MRGHTSRLHLNESATKASTFRCCTCEFASSSALSVLQVLEVSRAAHSEVCLGGYIWEQSGMRYVFGDVLESIQDGKTTMDKALLSQSDNYFNWDVELHRQAVLRNPDAFWATKHGKTRVELDEFHKYPRFKRLLGLI